MITAIDKNTALVLIDLQKGIVNFPTVHPVKEVLANAALLVSAFRSKGLPIVPVNVISAGSAWTKTRKEVKGFANPNALSNDFTEIVSEIKTQPNDIFITKHNWNAFFNTPLNDELQKRNITGIVLAGISTSIGVEGTARAASELGNNIIFATDAMTDRIPDAHNNSIINIFPRIGELGTTKEIIEMLNV